MLTALAILGIIALIVLIAGVVLIAVKLSETLSKQADVLDRAHERWVGSLDPIFDRLMAHNWEEYITIRQNASEDEGGFYPPEEEEEGEDVEQFIPGWGALSSANIPRPSAEEEKLLSEDFTDEDEPVRRIPS